MTHDDARAIVLRCLDEIAAGAGGETLAPDADLREALDLDSMDIFNLVTAICEQTGVDIPDREVAGLKTLDMFAARVATAAVGS
ncbi:MAG: acyl carrier protein [Thermoleophilia bacterium]